MKEEVNFLIEISKLKEMPRTGWVLREVKNPETIAEHSFRLAIFNWLLAKKSGFDDEKLIKLSLVHDLCEVYAGDVTPFFYYLRNLPKEKKEREKFLKKYVRLSEKEKRERGKEKFELEKNSLLKLIQNLNLPLKKEIFSLWLEFEKGTTREGEFVKEADKVETLLQAIEYFGTKKESFAQGWWEECEEFVQNPLLLEFLKVIQRKFYQKFSIFKKEKSLENILDFLVKVGKLKKIPRLYWILKEIKNPETVGGHVFSVAMAGWIFGKYKGNLNLEKILKMALCHEFAAVYIGDTTPYDRILPKDEKERKKILAKMIRLSKKLKEWIFLSDFKKEKKAIEKLTKKIPQKREILNLWEDYRKKKSKEAKFLSQMNVICILLEGLIYEKKYKTFSASPLWEFAFENCDDELSLSILDYLKEKFYGN